MNRLGLDLWGLALDDGDFARAVAAAGVAEAAWERLDLDLDAFGQADAASTAASLIGQTADGRLRWSRPNLMLGGVDAANIRGRLRQPGSAPFFARLWTELARQLTSPVRLRIDGEPDALLAGFARLLQNAAVGAQSVSLQSWKAANGHVNWELPFTFATLPADPIAPHLLAMQTGLPPTWPYRFAAIDRSMDRPEVLVVGTNVAKTLAGLMAQQMHVKCSLLLIAGLSEGELEASMPLLGPLAIRLRADGIAVLPVSNGLAYCAQQVRWLGDQLAHNQPLDAAIASVFGAGALLLASDDLLRLSSLSRAIDDLQTRLRKLPGNAGIALSPDAVARLQFEQILWQQRLQQQNQASVTRSWEDRIRWTDAFRSTGRGTTIVREAAEAARREVERQDEVTPPAAIPSPQPMPSPSPEPPELVAPAAELSEGLERARDSFAFGAESAEASALTEVTEQVRAQEVIPALLTPRYIQQQSFTAASGSAAPETRGFVVGEAVSVHVRIGPVLQTAGWTVAAEVFPDEALPKDRAVHPLRVLFHEARQFDEPMLGALPLPATGTSDEARFSFTPREAGPFEARITLLHKNRVLQTALLRTRVAATRDALPADGRLALDVEVEVRRNLAELGTRQRFDLAMVLNHTPAGQRRMTALSGRRAWASDLSGVDKLVDDINAALSEVANDTRGYDKGLDKGKNPELLVRLARMGRALGLKLDPMGRGVLVSEGLDLTDERVTHIQVISTRIDEVVPIEFIYDYPAPAAEGARVCPQHKEALQNGKCAVDCPGRKKPAAHVCPMGFWGLRKVIERHAYNPRLKNPDGADLVLQAEPVGDRDRLHWGSGSVLGHSERVAHASVEAVAARLGAVVDKQHVAVAKHWKDWKQLVKKHKPGLLIAFPHNTTNDAKAQLLEMGKATLDTLEPDATYVTDAPDVSPIVFLLGCNTAGTDDEFRNHLTFFRNGGAAVVVSTIATVFGAHAVRVGDEIVRALLAPRSGDNERLGEVLREAKRQALLASVPMALCVVAFGDADWKL